MPQVQTGHLYLTLTSLVTLDLLLLGFQTECTTSSFIQAELCLLSGQPHGQQPKLTGGSLKNWFTQTPKTAIDFQKKCHKIPSKEK